MLEKLCQFYFRIHENAPNIEIIFNLDFSTVFIVNPNLTVVYIVEKLRLAQSGDMTFQRFTLPFKNIFVRLIANRIFKHIITPIQVTY